jgi:hypothetical protein
VISLNLSPSTQAGAGFEPLPPEPGELDWRGAYLRVLAQEPLPPAEPQPLPRPLFPLPVGELPLQPGASWVSMAPLPHAAALPAQDPAPPSRVGQAPQEPLLPAEPPPSPLPFVLQLPSDAAPAPMAPLTPTVTAQRVDALLAQAPAAPSRVWRVELPAAQPGWQLRVEQLQPQAPLRLDLSVPLALQPQARRQLAELDKRLREAGHEVHGTRLSDSPRLRPQRVDEVQS